MSDNIPFDIQKEIIKKVSDIKSLIRFRSVSKPWRSFIESSEFIKGYGTRHTQPHSCILSYKVDFKDKEPKYICLVDNDIETFKVQQELAPSLVSPLIEQYDVAYVVGACHGLFCFVGYNKVYDKRMLVIWNPCIRKSFGIAAPRTSDRFHYGFGVCPVTTDPTVVKILCADNMPWHVEVFTLSSGVWNVIPTGNLPRHSIKLLTPSTQVVIDRLIYWAACDETIADNGVVTKNYMVVSFDLITKEFKVLNLPGSLTNKLLFDISVSRLMGSLVVYGDTIAEGAIHCGVWVMENDSSFRKLFSIGASVNKILWFMENGEPIFEIYEANGQLFTTLNVYDPCSKQLKNLGISGFEDTFFMGSYKESLLLLDHSDLHTHSDRD